MKKRNKIISILSSIFGVSAICSLFVLSSIGFEKQIEETKAVDTNDTVMATGVYSNSYVDTVILYNEEEEENNSYDVTVDVSYTYYLKRHLAENITYTFSFENFRLDFDVYNVTTGSDLGGFTLGKYFYNESIQESEFIYPFSFDISNLSVLADTFTLSATYNFLGNTRINTSFNLLYGGTNYLEVIRLGNEDIIVYPFEYADYLYDANTSMGTINMTSIFTNDYEQGYQQGYQEGYNVGYQNGNQEGYNNGYQAGQNTGYNGGYAEGYDEGVLAGKEEQSQSDLILIDQAYQDGYYEGFSQGESQDDTVNSIFGGITTVALVPIKFFLQIFNFEILGVNVASVVSALMSICLVIIVWRAVMGGKTND